MTRRRLVVGSAALAASIGLLRVGASAQGTPVADGTWSFTDDRGRTIELPQVPTRLVAETAVGATLWDFGIQVDGIFGGDLVGQNGEPATFVGRMETDQMTYAGVDAAELDIESLAALRPEVILGTTWEPDDPDDFGGYPESELGGLPQLAPTLAIRVVNAPVNVPLERFAELAAALGGDLNAPEVIEAKAAFEAACEEVRSATAEKPGLNVLAFYAGADGMWVANPTVASDLMLFMDLGVEMVVPDSTGLDMGGFWEQLSWETINKYHADLLLADDRTFSMSREQLMEIPSFPLLPAVIADQIGAWSVEYVISYQGLTTVLQALAESIRNADVLPA